MTIRSVFSITMLALVTACSFGQGEGKNAQQDRLREEQNDARRKVDMIAGQWVGTLNRAGQTVPMLMTLRSKSVENGRTADGTPIFRFDTQAALSSPSGRTYSANFTGNFDPATGEILLNNAAAKDPDDLQALRLTYNGATLSGALEAVQYTLGPVEFRRSQNPGDDGRDEEDRQNDLERQLFNKMVGYYYGTVTTTAGYCLQYNVCLQVYIEEQGTPRGGFKPLLKASYYREDVSAGSVLDKVLKIDYNYRALPQTVNMSSQGVPQPFPGSYTVQINGQFAVDANRQSDLSRFQGYHLSVNQGIQGRLTMQKVGVCPARPVDGRCAKVPPTAPR